MYTSPEMNSQTLPAIHEYCNLQDNQTRAIGNWADVPLLQFPRVIKACVCIPPVSVLHTLKWTRVLCVLQFWWHWLPDRHSRAALSPGCCRAPYCEHMGMEQALFQCFPGYQHHSFLAGTSDTPQQNSQQPWPIARLTRMQFLASGSRKR